MTVLVVTPVFSTPESPRRPLLAQTIASVRGQSLQDYLHVVVDDGSRDDLWLWMREEARYDARLHVVYQANAGASSAINYGIRAGLALRPCDCITVIHSDDLLTRDSLELRVQAARQAPFVFSQYWRTYDDGPGSFVIDAPGHHTAAELYQALLRENCMNSPTMFWRTGFLLDEVGLFDSDLRSAEDWDMALRSVQALVRGHETFACVDRPTAVYRFHKSNLHHQNIADGTRAICYARILSKHLSGWKLARALAHWLRHYAWVRFPRARTWKFQLRKQRQRAGRLLRRAFGRI